MTLSEYNSIWSGPNYWTKTSLDVSGGSVTDSVSYDAITGGGKASNITKIELLLISTDGLELASFFVSANTYSYEAAFAARNTACCGYQSADSLWMDKYSDTNTMYADDWYFEVNLQGADR